MGNIIDYVLKEKMPFAGRGFGEVDSLVLAEAAYFQLDGIVGGFDEAPARTLRELFSGEEGLEAARRTRAAQENVELARALSRSARFGEIKVGFYVNIFSTEEEEQFSAMTFLLPDGTAYLSFRGTNGTIVGWKEDFNMTYMSPVPAQRDGAAYLCEVAGRIGNPLRLGGHSKGGNVAVYAAMSCEEEVQNRILAAYNHDGPGFREEIFQSEGFVHIRDRVFKTMPRSSLIGMLLTSKVHYSVVKSTRRGVHQHDPFSWVVKNGNFSCAEKLTATARLRGEIVNGWVREYSDDKRALFIDTFYQAVKATNVETLGELTGDGLKNAATMLQAMNGVDEETKRFVMKTLGALFSLSMREVFENLPIIRREERKQGKKVRRLRRKVKQEGPGGQAHSEN